MSLKAMAAVFDLPQSVGTSARCILLAMADHADDEGYCFPSVTKIEAKTAVSRSTVKRTRQDLVEAGWLAKIGSTHATEASRKGVDSCSRWLSIPVDRRPALYRLTFVTGAHHEPSGGSPDAERGSTVTPPGGSPRAPNHSVQPPINQAKHLSKKPADWNLNPETNTVEGFAAQYDYPQDVDAFSGDHSSGLSAAREALKDGKAKQQ